MDGQYPIKTFKPTKPEKSTIITLTGKMGKIIEATYNNQNPDIVNFHIKSNRGTLKDTIEFPVDRIIDLGESIAHWHELFTKED